MICFPEHTNNNPPTDDEHNTGTQTPQSSMILFEAYFKYSAPSEFRQRQCLFYYLLYLFVAWEFICLHERDWRFGDLSKLRQKVLQMGMTVISVLLNVERSPNVFVYGGAADLWLGAGAAHGQVKITCRARDHHYELRIGQCWGTIDAAPGRHSATSLCWESLCVIMYLWWCFPEGIIWKCECICASVFGCCHGHVLAYICPFFMRTKLPFPNLCIYTRAYAPWHSLRVN